MTHFLSVLSLEPIDSVWLEIKDVYGLHRTVYNLFGMGEKDDSKTSQTKILWRLTYDTSQHVRILILSNQKPRTSEFGKLYVREIPENLLESKFYRYSICVNPTRCVQTKRVPIFDSEEIFSWFEQKAASSGFRVNSNHIAINNRRVLRFKKQTGIVTLFQVDLSGTLEVTNKTLFSNTFFNGFGRGKAFGCGLLQVIPIS